MHRVCKKESGMRQGAPQGVHVEGAAELKGIYKEKRDGLQGCGKKQNIPDVIVIEDDVGDSEVENYDSESFLRRSQSRFCSSSSGHSGSESSYDIYEDSSGSSDEEDCVVIEPHASVPPSFLDPKFSRAGKRPRPPADTQVESSRKRRSSPSDLSDCEIVLDFDGKVKQDWEEAALRRRTGKARRAESEESTSASIHANNDARRSPKGNDRCDVQDNVRRSWEHVVEEGSSSHAKEKKEDGVLEHDSNLNVSDIGSDDSAEEALSPQNVINSSGQDLEANVKPGVTGNELPLSDSVEASKGLDSPQIDIFLKPSQCVEANGTLISVDRIVTDREILKSTEEFRHADEEEWARRRLELKKQNEGAQRERKKRKLEAERRIEMEARQKRRLEEIRQSQLKEEQTSDFKDQIRDRVQSELDRIATTCRDMATLLRQLGVPVDGGAFATDQQVNAAYKKALLRFHPDRAAALAKSDPTSQVVAEEKFKLVSRMKSEIPLVSGRFFR